jgi:hypothetical protein
MLFLQYQVHSSNNRSNADTSSGRIRVALVACIFLIMEAITCYQDRLVMHGSALKPVFLNGFQIIILLLRFLRAFNYIIMIIA